MKYHSLMPWTLRHDQRVRRKEVNFKGKRARFVMFFHITSECLNKVEECLGLDNNLLGAECWLKMADNAFKEALFWAEKQKPYPEGSETEEIDKKDIIDLMGHLEGAREVIQEVFKK